MMESAIEIRRRFAVRFLCKLGEKERRLPGRRQIARGKIFGSFDEEKFVTVDQNTTESRKAVLLGVGFEEVLFF
jgi:hypothetical protein